MRAEVQVIVAESAVSVQPNGVCRNVEEGMMKREENAHRNQGWKSNS